MLHTQSTMTTPAHILYPQPPSVALRLGLPPIAGVVIYTVIRIVADSNNYGFIDFTRPLWLFALECGSTILDAFLIHEAVIRLRLWLYKRVFERDSEDRIVSQNKYLLKEIRWIFVTAFCMANALGLPFTALTDDGLSFFDFFVNNLVTIVFITAYLLATRGRDYVRLLSASELELERYKHDITSARLQALRNQINPHFLFNSLNTLSSLVHRDANAADDFIQELAKVYRYVLEHAERDLVPLRTELTFAESYIFLLHMRFKEGLRITINIDEALEDFFVPPMTLQILIENAVKHNIVSPKEPLTIEISSDVQGFLLVENNLQERSEKDTSSSVGLANITARYEFLAQKPLEIVRSADSFLVKIPLLGEEL